MQTIHWLGCGLSSLPGIGKIAKSEHRLIVWNRSLAKAKAAVDTLNADIQVNELDWAKLDASVAEGDVVVSMLPGTLHLKVAQLCLSRKAHFVCSSYVSPELAALDQDAKSAGLCFVNEVGLDPGLDHLLAHTLLADYRSAANFSENNQHYFRSYCGGFPKHSNDFKYKFSWSPLGVLKALKSPAQWIAEGKVQRTEKPWLALSDFETRLATETETFQAYPNRDSLPFREEYGFYDSWNLQEFVRGTLRLNGWSQAWSELFDEVDRLSGADGDARLQVISDDLWQRYQYAEGEADRVVLSVELEVKDSQGLNTIWHASYGLDESGDARGSAMARLVSLTVAIAIESLLAGELQIGVMAAPHDQKTVASWLSRLASLDEKVFGHQIVE
jgi:hypothetical protein